MEAEIKELEEEIGELNGLDDDMVDCVGFGQSFQPTKIGSFVSMSAIPADWKEVITPHPGFIDYPNHVSNPNKSSLYNVKK